jgi:phosphinothricin acetyltransferase
MKVEIRDMDSNDWEEVANIYCQGLLLGKSTFQTECPTYEEWDKSHIKECRYVLINGDLVIGWAALSPTSARQIYKGVVEVSIYIDENYRGAGLGSMLLRHICDTSEEMGYYSLYASIFEVNKASYYMNLKNGFREVGFREKIAKDRFGNWQNTIIMERRSKKIL